MQIAVLGIDSLIADIARLMRPEVGRLPAVSCRSMAVYRTFASERGDRVPISERAKAVVAGLVRTGRAATYEPMDFFILADGVGRVRYWISSDGGQLLRGRTPTTAEELQPVFIDAMARAGSHQ